MYFYFRNFTETSKNVAFTYIATYSYMCASQLYTLVMYVINQVTIITISSRVKSLSMCHAHFNKQSFHFANKSITLKMPFV